MNDTVTAFKRIATALRRRGIRIIEGDRINDPAHLADLIAVACDNVASRTPEERRLAQIEREA